MSTIPTYLFGIGWIRKNSKLILSIRIPTRSMINALERLRSEPYISLEINISPTPQILSILDPYNNEDSFHGAYMACGQ